MDYEPYLPNIDVEDGKARVMNNTRLYFRLLGKFDGPKMAAAIKQAIAAKDAAGIIQATHALRGTAANLAFPALQSITNDIETLTKASQDCSHLVEQLDEAIMNLSGAIEKLLQEQ